ncbi:MAG: hypothetical protein A2231_09440 [Candidatus Firestonebacteria bacterium RIFOXYA2_FULL_40_8]|nr:MAG: hypothetical protein A2231_09440 [Candidatus Firestonebacteria bacterium RIFOXYA2_FULL_40_8]
MLRNTWKNLKTIIFVKYLRILKRKETTETFRLSNISKVLIVRLDKVGDLILSTPVFENIKKTIPGSKITALVRSYNSGVLKNNPFIDQILEYDKFADRQKLKTDNYDLAINLIYDFSLESSCACYLSRAKYRAGYKDQYSKEFLNIMIEKDKAPKYELLRNLDILKSLGFKTDVKKSRLYPAKSEDDYTSAYFESIGVEKNDLIIGFNPGTGRKRREWPLEKYVALGKVLTVKYNARIIVLWGSADKTIALKIVKSIGPNAFMACKTDIVQLASLLKRFKLLVCGNTGPAHAAIAMDVPLVGLYGENDHINWTPEDKSKLRILSAKRCRNIEVADVLEGVNSFL